MASCFWKMCPWSSSTPASIGIFWRSAPPPRPPQPAPANAPRDARFERVSYRRGAFARGICSCFFGCPTLSEGWVLPLVAQGARGCCEALGLFVSFRTDHELVAGPRTWRLRPSCHSERSVAISLPKIVSCDFRSRREVEESLCLRGPAAPPSYLEVFGYFFFVS